MKTENQKRLVRLLKAYLNHVPISRKTQMDEKILANGFAAMEKAHRNQTKPYDLNMWRYIMKSRAVKIVAAVVVFAVILSIGILGNYGKSAWALEHTIDALKPFHAVQIEAVIPGEKGSLVECNAWLRAGKSGLSSQDLYLKTADGNNVWVKGGVTYFYSAGQNTVYFEDAVTQGFSHWFGPRLFALLEKADNLKTIYGTDPATGRDRVTLFWSIVDTHGPQSWMFEFDVETKLPISMKQWPNLDRSGPASFWAKKIIYYENLPDSTFMPDIPEDAQYIEKEPTIPEHNLALLANPKYGISAEGMTHQEAAQEIIRQLYDAIMREDMDRIKTLCPVAELWGDKLLKTVVMGITPDEKLVEVVKIGPIVKEGKSKLGTFVVVPSTLKRRDGTLWREKMFVQFRGNDSETSCVVHGPYGHGVQLE